MCPKKFTLGCQRLLHGGFLRFIVMQPFYARAKRKTNNSTYLKYFRKFCKGINTKHHLHHFFCEFCGGVGNIFFNPKTFNNCSYNIFFKMMLIVGSFFSYVKTICFTSDGLLYKMV